MVLIFLILGLIIGSFLNVVVYRLNLAETIMGRSHCPHCRRKIRGYDNIPIISFILLGAKCRDCAGKISWQYPAMELLTGAIFALTGAAFFQLGNTQSWFTTLFYLGLFSLLLVIFLYDYKYMEIPMVIIWSGVVLAIAFNLFWDVQHYVPLAGIFALKTVSGLAAGAGAFAFFFALSAGSKEKWMGMGDAYLALLVGLVVGLAQILPALLLAFTIGAAWGVGLIVLKKKNMKSQIPFGPFLVIGAMAAIFIFKLFPMVNYWML